MIWRACKVCNDKRYLVSERADGTVAIETCDECCCDVLTDTQAAILARHDGIDCRLEYPCYVTK
jgi:hypothetical protein